MSGTKGYLEKAGFILGPSYYGVFYFTLLIEKYSMHN